MSLIISIKELWTEILGTLFDGTVADIDLNYLFAWLYGDTTINPETIIYTLLTTISLAVLLWLTVKIIVAVFSGIFGIIKI